MNLISRFKERERLIELRSKYGDFGEDVFKKEIERKRFFDFVNYLIIAPTGTLLAFSVLGFVIFGAYSEIWRGMIGVVPLVAISGLFGIWESIHSSSDRKIVEKHINSRG